MGILFVRLRHKPAGSVFSDVNAFSSLTIRQSMKAESSQIQIGLSNKFGRYSGLSTNPSTLASFNEDDEIAIYAANDTIVLADNLLMTGTIKEWGFGEDEQKVVLDITAMDRTYELLKNIFMPGKFDSVEGLTAPEAIKKVVRFATYDEDSNSGFNTDNVETTPTGKSTDPAGAVAFKEINEAMIHKTGYEWIQTLSKDPHTRYTVAGSGDYNSARAFIFFVDENENFHWKYPSNVVADNGTINLTDPSLNILTTKLKKSIFDVVNMVIYNAGIGPNGKGIQWYFFDESSKITGLNIRVQPMIDIARDLQQKEKAFSKDNGEPFDGEYPDFSSFGNYTTSWGETVTNDGEYQGNRKSGFKGKCIELATSRARKITINSANLRWKGRIEMKGTKTFAVGDLLSVSDERFNLNSTKIRLVGLNHLIKETGWFTTLEVEEDENEVVIN